MQFTLFLCTFILKKYCCINSGQDLLREDSGEGERARQCEREGMNLCGGGQGRTGRGRAGQGGVGLRVGGPYLSWSARSLSVCLSVLTRWSHTVVRYNCALLLPRWFPSPLSHSALEV